MRADDDSPGNPKNGAGGVPLRAPYTCTFCGCLCDDILLEEEGGRVVEARSDTAPYATVESGIRFRLHDPAAVSSRWRATRSALRSLG